MWLVSPLLLWSVHNERDRRTVIITGGSTIIIINGAANESYRLNNSCATHDSPVLLLLLHSFFFSLPLLFGGLRVAQMRESTYKWEAPETSCRSTTIRIVINQPCARIYRDVTTLFCRSSAFSPRWCPPCFPSHPRSHRLFRQKITTPDTWHEANSTQRYFNRETES